VRGVLWSVQCIVKQFPTPKARIFQSFRKKPENTRKTLISDCISLPKSWFFSM
jgi:hypothetical protein